MSLYLTGKISSLTSTALVGKLAGICHNIIAVLCIKTIYQTELQHRLERNVLQHLDQLSFIDFELDFYG